MSFLHALNLFYKEFHIPYSCSYVPLVTHILYPGDRKGIYTTYFLSPSVNLSLDILYHFKSHYMVIRSLYSHIPDFQEFVYYMGKNMNQEASADSIIQD